MGPFTPTQHPAKPPRYAAGMLLALSAVSLFLTTLVNGAAARMLEILHPGCSCYARACIPSALVAMASYLMIRPSRPFALPDPNTPWVRVLRLSTLWQATWLLASVAYALFRGGWTAYATGPALLIAFLLLGPLWEELLFRGAIFELAERAVPASSLAPILLSSLLFSVHHMELHGFALTSAARLQVAFTFPMGLVFGKVRALSNSVWPGFLLHVLTNLPHAFGSH